MEEKLLKKFRSEVFPHARADENDQSSKGFQSRSSDWGEVGSHRISRSSPIPVPRLLSSKSHSISSMDLVQVGRTNGYELAHEVSSFLSLGLVAAELIKPRSLQIDDAKRILKPTASLSDSDDKGCHESPSFLHSTTSLTMTEAMSSELRHPLQRTNYPSLRRSNSTGTLYITATMMYQDDSAFIRCVCAVIKSHLLHSFASISVCNDKFAAFEDEPKSFGQRSLSSKLHAIARVAQSELMPKLDELVNFFSYIFNRGQLESECVIIALIYCERFVQEAKGSFYITIGNWRSVIFICLVMASKVWDDLSMCNEDFAGILTSWDLKRVNKLELLVLETLQWDMKVHPGTYAKYYFILRSLVVHMNLASPGPSMENNHLVPFDLAQARSLRLVPESKRGIIHGKTDNPSTKGHHYSDVHASKRGIPEVPDLPNSTKMIARYHSCASFLNTEESTRGVVCVDGVIRAKGYRNISLAEILSGTEHTTADGSVVSASTKRSRKSENK
eukprot:GSChrysophyteH1.ASY1.ANO1.2915.1 assembled CDS